MTRAAIAAAVFAVGLVATAGAVGVIGEPDLGAASARTDDGSTASPDSVLAPPDSTTSPPTPTVTTATPIARGPLTAADAAAALPKSSDKFGPADLEIELGSVCEGATFDLVGATPVYASLQSATDPLQYLDAVVMVYETVPGATNAYARLADQITQCPVTRTATPTPSATADQPVQIEIQGEVRADTNVDGRKGVQWVQIQSADGTELRTAITVVLVENALVAVSMDEDSETIGADDLATDSITQAQAIVAALTAAAGG